MERKLPPRADLINAIARVSGAGTARRVCAAGPAELVVLGAYKLPNQREPKIVVLLRGGTYTRFWAVCPSSVRVGPVWFDHEPRPEDYRGDPAGAANVWNGDYPATHLSSAATAASCPAPPSQS